MKRNSIPASKVKIVLQDITAVLQGRRVTASNDANVPVASGDEICTLANIFLPTPQEPRDDGWKMLAPYGDHRHAAGMQRFDRKAAETIVANFRSIKERTKRTFALGGDVPFFVGHPDDPLFANRAGHDDTRAYGWIKGLEARDDGLYFRAKWSEEGAHILANAHYRFLSPRWVMKPLARGIFTPHTLVSVGLTNQPNIPVPAISNQSQPNNTMNDLLKLILEKLGYTAEQIDAYLAGDEAAELTQDVIVAKVDELLAAAQREPEMANELAQKDQALVAANDTLEVAKIKAKADLVAANQKADELKKLVAANEAAAAVADGRIPLAEEQAVSNSLAIAEDFDAAVEALKQRKPAVHTKPHTAHLGRQQHITMSNAGQQFRDMVKQRQESTGEDFTRAWANCKVSQQGAELYKLMDRKPA